MEKSQIEAAVVKPNTLSVPFIKAPAPRKPIPVTTADMSVIEFASVPDVAIIPSALAPRETKMNVPKPTGLWGFCLSSPKKRESKKVAPSRDTTSFHNKEILQGKPLFN